MLGMFPWKHCDKVHVCVRCLIIMIFVKTPKKHPLNLSPTAVTTLENGTWFRLFFIPCCRVEPGNTRGSYSRPTAPNSKSSVEVGR